MRKIVLALALIIAVATAALAANITPGVTLPQPIYGPQSHVGSMTVGAGGDTLCFYVPGGFRAIRVWSPATSNTVGLRIWRVSGMSGQDESYEVYPKTTSPVGLPAASYRYVVMDSDGASNVTGVGWNEYVGIYGDYFVIYNGSGATLVYNVEIMR